MKIVALTVGDSDTGSTAFRIAQYIPLFEKEGHSVVCIQQKNFTMASLDTIADADVVINQKCLFPLSLSRKIRQASRRLIFDFDDAIYTRHGAPYSFLTQWRVNKRLRWWLSTADKVTVANDVLGQYARHYSSAVTIVPMALDTTLWKPRQEKKSETLIIGWAGAPHNLPYLEALEPLMASLIATYPHISFAVLSGEKPSLSIPFSYTPFSRGKEHLFTQKLDIGLLPLSDDPFSRGKSPIKAIQYLACGVPVIGTVIGATAEILNANNSIAVTSHETWLTALERLIHDDIYRITLGNNGRSFAIEHHDIKSVSDKLLTLITSLSEECR